MAIVQMHYHFLQVGYVDHVNGMQHDGTLFKRSSDRKAPHNSYTSKKAFKSAAENINASMDNEKMPSLSFHESIDSAKIGDSSINSCRSKWISPKFHKYVHV